MRDPNLVGVFALSSALAGDAPGVERFVQHMMPDQRRQLEEAAHLLGDICARVARAERRAAGHGD